MPLLASSYDESRFFRAEDLKIEVKLKIKNVTEEKMADGEMKLTVWFTNSKRGLVLNRTNNRTIRAAYGDAVDGWAGKIIVLYPTTAEFRGKMGPAMRVRIPPPKQATPASAAATPKQPASSSSGAPAAAAIAAAVPLAALAADPELDPDPVLSARDELDDEIDF